MKTPHITTVRGAELTRTSPEGSMTHYKFCVWSDPGGRDMGRCDLNGYLPLCTACTSHKERMDSPDPWIVALEGASEIKKENKPFAWPRSVR